MLRYNTATLTANVSEKVRILAENGQIPLAYMTAKSHGLDEFSKSLEATLIESEEYDHERIFREAEKFVGPNTGRPKALLPLRPVFTESESLAHSNWPMVNLRAKEAERASQMFRKKKEEGADLDDLFFDSQEYHTSNKQVANILQDTAVKEDTQQEIIEEANIDGAEWGGDDDIDIDMGADMLGDAAGVDAPLDINDDGNGFSDIFVPPSSGPDPIQQALKKNPQSIGLHIAAGDFTHALELLQKHLGIHDFSVLKQAFVDIHTLSKMKLQTLPHTDALDYRLRYVDQPLVSITLGTLQKMFNKGIEATSKGDFGGAIQAFRQCLQSVPLIIVTSDQANSDLQKLVGRLVEYITAMRIELERKRLVAAGTKEPVRVAELSCYMTLCGMDNAHKFLTFKNAMNGNYKIQNFITASHFARQILDLESTGIFATKPEVIAQHKKYF